MQRFAITYAPFMYAVRKFELPFLVLCNVAHPLRDRLSRCRDKSSIKVPSQYAVNQRCGGARLDHRPNPAQANEARNVAGDEQPLQHRRGVRPAFPAN